MKLPLERALNGSTPCLKLYLQGQARRRRCWRGDKGRSRRHRRDILFSAEAFERAEYDRAIAELGEARREHPPPSPPRVEARKSKNVQSEG